MIPMEAFALEQHIGNDGKDDERNALLDNFELYQSEGAAIANEAYTIGWHLTAIFEECYYPTKYNDTKQRPGGADPRLLKAKRTVPSYCQADIAQYQQQDSV